MNIAIIPARVGVNLHYIPIYRHPYYEAMGFKAEYFPEAEKYYKETVSIPIYSMLCNEEQERLIHCLYEIFE